jgi:hypothetical protein
MASARAIAAAVEADMAKASALAAEGAKATEAEGDKAAERERATAMA